MRPPAGGVCSGWRYFCLKAALKETFGCQSNAAELLLGHVLDQGYENKQTRPLPVAGSSLPPFTHTSLSPLSRVSALLKDSINLKWTKESSEHMLPVSLSLPHIQLFSTPSGSLCPLQLFPIFPLLNSFILFVQQSQDYSSKGTCKDAVLNWKINKSILVIIIIIMLLYTMFIQGNFVHRKKVKVKFVAKTI